MRKTTIAIILLLSVTAVFAQRKHYSAVQTTGPGGMVNLYDFVSDSGYRHLNLPTVTHKFKCDTVYIRDTIRIKDTVNVPIYLVDVTDTMPATVMYKKDAKSDRVYTLKGFALVRGFKVMVQNKPQWADKPAVVGALDDKKRLIKNVIQVL